MYILTQKEEKLSIDMFRNYNLNVVTNVTYSILQEEIIKVTFVHFYVPE